MNHRRTPTADWTKNEEKKKTKVVSNFSTCQLSPWWRRIKTCYCCCWNMHAIYCINVVSTAKLLSHSVVIQYSSNNNNNTATTTNEVVNNQNTYYIELKYFLSTLFFLLFALSGQKRKKKWKKKRNKIERNKKLTISIFAIGWFHLNRMMHLQWRSEHRKIERMKRESVMKKGNANYFPSIDIDEREQWNGLNRKWKVEEKRIRN